MSFTGKVCIVAGASRGIGRVAAETLARAGAHVVVSSRDAAACEAVAAGIRQTGGQATAVAADVTRASDMQTLVDRVVQRHGRLDLAFHNAGNLFGMSPLHETAVKRFEDTIAVNLHGPFYGLHAYLPAMIKGGGGAIVVTTAGSGLRPRASLADTSASKWGANGLCQAAALEVAKHNVRINVVAPGFIATESWMALLGANAKPLAARVPLGRLGEASDVADVVMWLLGDGARYVTGAVIPVDGGLVLV